MSTAEAAQDVAPQGAHADELVTVVIPARNEERAIRDCVASIQAQTHRNLQIIVVDGDSEDGTAGVVKEIVDADPRVELVVNPQRVIPVSLNMAVQAARARWLVRVDAHATVPPDYVARALSHLVTGRWGGVGGRKDGVGRTAAGRAVAAAMASRFGVGGSTYHHGTTQRTVEHIPFGAYPLDVIRQLGGWDERLRVNQDFEFDYRVREAGHELLFDPQLRIDWESRQSVPALFSQYRRYGHGKVRVARLHPASLRVRHLAAPALVATAATAAVVAVRRPGRAAAMMAPYVVALGLASARTARTLDREAKPWVAPAFLAMHVGWGLGFWKGVAEAAQERLRGPGRMH
ncbi:glycosyltransferase family 2 protein [Blastococcus goldschmidtiae]|uniref:Glycosyltransferase family 2 protein n=1 Tax=Blastococcus goldschmidtiae TaxID=3075546 RepID=A0ABU2KAZ9_9ACTN|nr:glycosyltransferase family 2 protein [Blastococcus sp. DSM 46792]MDT0277370.1 glycosyltransferase family 2 protein [Blastococcus sp. DSM 46792]